MFSARFVATVALLASILTGSAQGQGPEDRSWKSDPVITQLDDKVQSFFNGVAAGATKDAFDTLLEGSKLAEQAEAVAGLVEKTEKIGEMYGRFRVVEQLAPKRLGSDVVLLRHLYKCEHFPVVWYFAYYRPPLEDALDERTWRIVTVRFDTDLERLAE